MNSNAHLHGAVAIALQDASRYASDEIGSIAIANLEDRLKVREQRMPAIVAWVQKHGG